MLPKDKLTNYEQLLALDLNTVFPGIQVERLHTLDIHPPTIGEVSLIVSVFGKEEIPDNLVTYIKQLTPKNSSFIQLINSWNKSTSTLKEIVAPSIANTMADSLSGNFHKHREEAIFYKNTLLLATQNMLMTKLQGPSL